MSRTGDFSEYYDKFSMSLAGMQVLVAKPGTYKYLIFLSDYTVIILIIRYYAKIIALCFAHYFSHRIIIIL